MKSFATRVRDALTRGEEQRPDTRDSRRAELTGLALTCGTMTLAGGGNIRLGMRTTHAGTGRHIVRLLRREFSIKPGLRILRASRLGGRTTFEIRLEGEDAKAVMAACDLSLMEQDIPRHCHKSRRSRDAFLRGAFLGCGRVNNPERGYQMEFAVTSGRMATSLSRFLHQHYDLTAGIHERKGTHVVYLHDSDAIITVLACVGAHGAILEFENVRITKDARNRANRAANCDSGNITKILGAAEKQLEAIEVIERTIGLEALPDTLREVALERKLYADLALEALGAQLDPPVGKSGVHHRLKRLEALARSLMENEKEEDI